MPTVPVMAAGWRIEPPVSVAVAPRQGRRRPRRTSRPRNRPAPAPRSSPCAARGLTTGPEAAGLVRRAHGELVAVELAQHDGAGIPQVLRHRRLVGRREIVEDVGAGRGAHALGAVEVLDAQRQAFQRPRLALGQPRVARLGLRQRVLRRRQHVGIERACCRPRWRQGTPAPARSPRTLGPPAPRALRQW